MTPCARASRATHEVDFSFELGDIGALPRQRLYAAQRRRRRLPDDSHQNILTLEQLGMPPVLKQLCNKEKGLVLVTGPTGSGKSTTLAAMIDYLNERL
jgi:twitching motility protein PilT